MLQNLMHQIKVYIFNLKTYILQFTVFSEKPAGCIACKDMGAVDIKHFKTNIFFFRV